MTMILSVAVVAALGLGLGWLLGLASQWLGATTDPVVERLTEALPGSQCGQCGYPGCGQAAIALSKGEAPVTLCPPGGRVVAEKLAEILGTTFDPGNLPDRGPLLARVRTDYCIGCSRVQSSADFRVAQRDPLSSGVSLVSARRTSSSARLASATTWNGSKLTRACGQWSRAPAW